MDSDVVWMLITSLEAFYLTGPDRYVVGGLWKDRRGQELGLDGETTVGIQLGWLLISDLCDYFRRATSERFLFYLFDIGWNFGLGSGGNEFIYRRGALDMRLEMFETWNEAQRYISDLEGGGDGSLDQMFQTWSGDKGRVMLAWHQAWQGDRGCENASLKFELNCCRWR